MLSTIPFLLVRTAALALAATVPASESGDEVLDLGRGRLERIEQQANVHAASTQEQAALGRDAAGRSVVVWQSKRQEADGSFGIYARRFGSDGAPLGGEVHVNLRAEGAQLRPAVALADSGAAWLVWETYGQDGDRGGVVLRRLAPDLGAGTNELLVDTVRDGHQAEPAVAVDAEGRALVVWTGPATPVNASEVADEAGPAPDERARVVRARLYAPDATSLGAPFELASAGPGIARLPAVEADADGGFRVAFAHTDLEGRPAGVALAQLDRSGSLVSMESVVDGPAIEPALAVDAGGSTLVAWMDGRDGDWRPALRWMHPGGAEVRAPGAVRVLDSLPASPDAALELRGHASGLGVALDGAGRALLAWSLLGERTGSAVLVQPFLVEPYDAEPERSGLAPAGRAQRVSAAAGEGDRRLAVGGPRRLAPAADGSLALAWNGAGAGDGSGVYLTLLAPEVACAAAALAAPADPLELDTAAPHDPPVYTGPVDPRLAAVKSSRSGPDHGFEAITQTSLTPPDPHVSAGPDHLVVVTNGRLSFFDQEGTETFTQALDGFSGFFAPVGAASGFIFDPETLYDPHSGRFMVMANERNGNAFFLLGVSDDSDPNGTWHKYRFDVTAAVGDTDIDSPNFAVDDGVVYLTADFFGPDKFLVFMVEKAPLLAGAAGAITRSLVVNGSQSFGVPVTYDAGAPAQYMLEAFESFSNTAVRFHAISDPLGAPQRQTVDLTVPTYTQPEDPPQQGTSVRPNTFESRFWSCMYRDGSLWATHHVNSSQVRQRWYQFAMNGWPQSGQTPTLAQWGEVVPGEGVRTFFGSIWADGDGNAGLSFARSSPTEFISFSRAFRQAGDPPGQMTPAVAMQSSTEPDTSGRWGDYSGTAADPEAGGAFWTCGEYRQAGIWRTWVGLMGPCESPTAYCTPKLTSTGSTPSVGFVGEPSVGLDDFHVTMTGGLPGKSGIAFFGAQPAAIPFFGGTKCVANPVKRTPIFQLDASGSASVAVPVSVGDLGQTRYYQFWFRDPQHPDGTTVGLSDGLQVTFCP